MNPNGAVCPRCGAWKTEAWRTCRRCRLDPRADSEAFAKCVFLSVDRFDDPVRRESYRAELKEMATAIAAGGPVVFDPDELARIQRRSRDASSVTARAAWGAVFRTFRPGLLFLAALVATYVLLRLMRR